MGPSGWVLRGPGTRGGYELHRLWILHQNIPQKNPTKPKINNCSGKRYRAWRRNSGEAVSWTYMLIIFCAEMHPSKMSPWQFTNTEWSKEWQSQTLLLLLPLFIFFLSATESSKKRGCRCENRDSLIFHHLVEQLMQDLRAAPVAIAPHVVMLAHLAGFGPQHFCKWKVLCVVY